MTEEPRHWIVVHNNGESFGCYGPFGNTEDAVKWAEEKWPDEPSAWDIDLLWPPEL